MKCEVCGDRLQPLFTSLSCFNENCLGDRKRYHTFLRNALLQWRLDAQEGLRQWKQKYGVG